MASPNSGRTRRYVPAVGPRLTKLLAVVFGLFALLSVNAVYLFAVRVAGWITGQTYEDLVYLYMFLAHLVLGVVLIAPLVVFGILHIRNAHDRPNRRAVRVGYALYAPLETLVGAALCVFVAHMGGSSIWVGSTTLWQKHVDDAFRGRTYSLELLAMTLAFGGAGLCAGLLYDWTGSLTWTTWIFACSVVVGGLVWWTLVRDLVVGKTEPAAVRIHPTENH